MVCFFASRSLVQFVWYTIPPRQPCKVFSQWLIIYPRVYRLQHSPNLAIRVKKYLQLGTVQGNCEKFSSLFVRLTIMMEVIIHQIANQRWPMIWIWRVILISRFGSAMPHIWITIYFSSIQQTCAPFPVMKHNVPQCSLMADSQSLVSWLGQLSGLAALAAQSCMLTWDFANMG